MATFRSINSRLKSITDTEEEYSVDDGIFERAKERSMKKKAKKLSVAYISDRNNFKDKVSMKQNFKKKFTESY